jgi:branched-chain amino acid transport system permease protein
MSTQIAQAAVALPAGVAPPTSPAVSRSTRASTFAAVAGLLALLMFASMPWWAERSELRLATEFFCVLALAQMWNLLAGYGGLASMGQQAFVGLGAYALVVFGLKAGLGAFWVVPLAGVAGALIALPTALVVFRLRGAYFAVGTWVVAEVFRLVIANLPQVAGGSGLSVTAALHGMEVWWRDALSIWLALGLGAGGTLAVYALLRSRWGLALTAVRDSEPASESLGVGVHRIKWAVYVAAAAGTAMTGALIFVTKLRVSPDAAFSLEWTTMMFFAVVIGGIGTLEGPILGTLAYFALREGLSEHGSLYLIVLGGVTIAVMLWAPRGLWGLVSQRLDLQLFPVRRRVRSSR